MLSQTCSIDDFKLLLLLELIIKWFFFLNNLNFDFRSFSETPLISGILNINKNKIIIRNNSY